MAFAQMSVRLDNLPYATTPIIPQMGESEGWQYQRARFTEEV
eukprot:CAMPEP_0171104450 /NCGR_PEP_ID=MMETSP0766_2-20121228/60676_1 /TAXON_ID=439317 /ORGANISM="Gambierdiscus australes, Strain CAWD 149" /LENGTH=41 /DNA_ID= /DNA_START= /DNA_END= /DNA_ORIENTATION=